MKIDVSVLPALDIVALTMVLTRKFGVQHFALSRCEDKIYLHLLE